MLLFGMLRIDILRQFVGDWMLAGAFILIIAVSLLLWFNGVDREAGHSDPNRRRQDRDMRPIAIGLIAGVTLMTGLLGLAIMTAGAGIGYIIVGGV